jgi:hypothetical protein
MSGRPDPDDDAEVIRRERELHTAMLRAIPDERAELDQRERDMVRYARLLGIGWDEIAAAIGHEDNITVQEKYGEPEPGADPF